MDDSLRILGLVVCISQSACLSGLNLAVFSLSRLRLEVAARGGDRAASKVLGLRKDGNFTLVTILWGNVAVNVLLTLLADSLLTGLLAFLFSTVVITLIGEIFPQAYFSRNALRVASLLAPLLRFYQLLLWPVAKPLAKLLDHWVGPEVIPWYQEHELREVLFHHAEDPETELSRVEAIGAINFLALDDRIAAREGEELDPLSIITLKFVGAKPVFPDWQPNSDDPFLVKVANSEKKWVVLLDDQQRPRLVLNAHEFLRRALFSHSETLDATEFCHRPLITYDLNMPLGRLLSQLQVEVESPGDDVIDEDLILVWGDSMKRIITGSDILGFLMRRISRRRSSQS